MSKLENARARFTEDKFVSALFPLLRENGVIWLNEKELKKKLYCYYLKEEYKELFQDIVPFNQYTASDKMINIENGLLNFKTFGGNVIWDDMHPEDLMLTKGYSDLSWCKECLSEDGIQKLQKLAFEFGIRNCVEFLSSLSFQIYPKEPNGFYHLCRGNRYDKIYSWELITDGKIGQMEINKNPNEHLQYEDPSFSNWEVPLKNAISSTIEIENASFALMQGLENENLKRVKAYTDIIDLKTLKQIRDIKREDCVCITNEAPFVRKYTLK